MPTRGVFMPTRGAAVGVGAMLVAVTAVTTGSAYAATGAAPAQAADPGGTPLLRETFTGTTVPEFTGYNEACLTGAPAGAPPPGDHALGGCEPTEIGPVPPLDAAPHGYLRLTDAGRDRSAAVLFNHALPASEGLDVTFDAWQYGNNPNDGPPADGISFFLTNGEANLTVPGAFGGSLGYAKKQPTPNIDPTGPFIPGVEDGYLGVGRTMSLPVGVSPAEAERLLEVSRRRINVRVTPAPDPRVIVTVDFNNGTGPHQVLDVPAPVPVPRTYKFGFAASTGDFNDVHLIRNVAVGTDQPLPRLELVKQVMEPRPAHLGVGDHVHYEFVVTNSGDTPITNLTVHNPVVGPVTCPRTTLAIDETITCTATYTVTAADVARGFIANTALATGLANGRPVESPPSSEHLVLIEPPGIDIEKTVDTPGPFFAGKAVRYGYLITNTGGVTLHDVHVTDDHVTSITCTATTLTPGDSTMCQGTYVITPNDAFNGLVTNTAVASGVENGRTITSHPVQQTILVGAPRLTLRKQVGPGPHFPGGIAWYEYVVTNTGPIAIHDVAVIDDRAAHVTCQMTTLEPGQSTVCFGTYRITAFDAVLGSVTNIAQAGGVDSHGVMVVSEPASVTFRVSKEVPVTG